MFEVIMRNTVEVMCEKHKALSLALIGGDTPALVFGSGTPSAIYIASFSEEDRLSAALLLKFFDEFFTCSENGGEMEGVRIKPAIEGKSLILIPYIKSRGLKSSLYSIASYIKKMHIRNVFLIRSEGNSVCGFADEEKADSARTVCDILKACAGFEKYQPEGAETTFLKAVNKLTCASGYLLCTEKLKYSSIPYYYKKYREALMISALI